jgi:hypothetical protein
MQLVQLVVFCLVLNVAMAWFGAAGLRGWSQFAPSVLSGSLAVTVVASYPQLWFKPDERFLKIHPWGISTTIGERSGEVAWSEVASISAGRHYLNIVGTSGNWFGIPNSAFADQSELDEFVDTATRWWQNARDA